MNVWTDGACSGPGLAGGWAWVAEDGQQESGHDPSTTNQRMELYAALRAMQRLRSNIVIHTDSAYLHNCFTEGWYVKWGLNGWRNSAGEPVANADLWRKLIWRVERYKVTFIKVKGHSGDEMNDRVDFLAVQAKLQP